MHSLLSALPFLGLALAAPTASNGTPMAVVRNGTISGSHSDTYSQDMFLGIPYAQPPINELRFRNPQSLNTTLNSTYEATDYSPSCVGYGGDQIGYPVSEDCLTLNIVRPSGYEGEWLPVGVWIHGGGLSMGGSRDRRYNLSFIVENSVEIGKPIIGVSINYRLSAWGFLQSQEVAGSGNTNMGLRDQRLALHWLQENLAAFGGDPSKVTIWGESAGAASVGYHLIAYDGRDDGLFRSGIMESGNPVNYNSFRDMQTFQPLYDNVTRQTGCANSTDTLDCLRSVQFDQLNDLFNTSDSGTWQPIVDGDFIKRWASIQLQEGKFVQVPVIDGANTDEGTSFGPQGINTTEQFIEYISGEDAQARLPEALAQGVLDAYPDSPDYYIPPVDEVPANATFPAGSGDLYRRTAAYAGDVVMIANRRGTCETWAQWGVPAYCYRFDTIPAGIPWYSGVGHFQEVAFVFDNTDGLGYDEEHGTVNPFENKTSSYTDLAKLMSSSWASFIHDGTPNNFQGRYEQAEDWPVYSLDEPQNMVWDANRTELGYAEPDTWRAEGIRFILDHAKNYHR